VSGLIKKLGKIFRTVLAGAVVLIAASMLVLQLPVVQTSVASRLSKGLLCVQDAQVDFEKIIFKPLRTVIVKNLTIIDKHPYTPDEKVMEVLGSFEPVDTVLSARMLVVRFSLSGLLGNCPRFSYFEIDDADVNFVIEDGRTSIERLFSLHKDRGHRRKTAEKDIFSMRKLKAENLSYNMYIVQTKNAGKFADNKEGVINYSNLAVRDMDVDARRIGRRKGILRAEKVHTSFREINSGYACSISASVRIGNGCAGIEDLHITDQWSDLRLPYYRMNFKYPQDTRQFTDKIRIEGKIAEGSDLNTTTLGYFIPCFKPTHVRAYVSGLFDGNINDFTVSDFTMSTPNGDLNAYLSSVRIKDVSQIAKATISASFDKVRATTASLEKFFSDIGIDAEGKLSGYAKGEILDMNATMSGKTNKLKTKFSLTSRVGAMGLEGNIRNLMVRDSTVHINGIFRTDQLDLGLILSKEKLGKLSCGSHIRANFGGTDGTDIIIDSLMIDKLGFNGYDYSRIGAVGEVSDRLFNGKIVSQDPNLNFIFQGLFALSRKTSNEAYQFYANVGHANLHALNFDKKENSGMSFRTSANFKKTAEGDLLGNIDIADIVFESDEGKHNVGKVSISSHSNNDIQRIKLSSTFADGSFISDGSIGEFIKDLSGITVRKELPALLTTDSEASKGHNYQLVLDFKDSYPLTSFIKQGFYIDPDTRLMLSMDSTYLDASMKSRRIALNENYIKNVKWDFDNIGSRIGGKINWEELQLRGLSLLRDSAEFYADDNAVDLLYKFSGAKDGVIGEGSIRTHGALVRDDGKLKLDLNLLPTFIEIDKGKWNISPSGIHISKDGLSFDSILLSNGSESLRLDGGLSKEGTDTLSLGFDKFGIDILEGFFGSRNMELGGYLSGNASFVGTKGHRGLISDITCDSTSISRTYLGRIKLDGDWNTQFNRYDLSLECPAGLDAKGYLIPESGWMQIDAKMDSLAIGIIEPVTNGAVTDMDGYISGKLKLEGEMDSFHITSEGMRLQSAGGRIASTNVRYRLDGSFLMDEFGVHFDDMNIKDEFSGEGKIHGDINYDHFKDFVFDTQLDLEKMKVIMLSEKAGKGLYGDVSASASIDIAGPANALKINARATTLGSRSDIHIPIGGGANQSKTDLLTFKKAYEEVYVDPYELMMEKFRSKIKKKGQISLLVNLTATPDLEAFMDIDKETGNVLSGRGHGDIEFDYRPDRDIADLRGDYTLTNGNYRFVALGIASRDFSIQNGSSIKFGGQIMESTLDLDAIYKTKTSLSTLISDTTSVNTRRTVECGINISDKLKNPQLKFSINVPDLDPTVKAKVDNALSSDDKIQKQFLSLIISNSFLPDEQSGIVNNSSVLYSNVSEIMAGQLNKILDKLGIPVDLGLNYQPNTKGNDIFDVAVSTQLFNNRVVVNGNIGNRQYTSSSNQGNVVGDLDIEVKLDRPGAFRLNLFSHSADQYTNFLDNSQRNGAGLMYQQEFNKVKYLFQYMFAPKKKKEALELEDIKKQKQTKDKTIEIK